MQDRKIYSVSELNLQVRLLLEHQFDAIWLSGEISNFTHATSGHMYFSLKDSKAQIQCAMFAGRNRQLSFTPKDGLQIVLRAKVSLYENRGNYQLLVDYMEEAGDGALKRAFEILKQKLAAEGLFDPQYKKTLPVLPRCIGLITSAKGAAVHDILTTLRRRFPSIPVIIYPAQVQGTDAPTEICHAIEAANHNPLCDVLIVGRGGGSLEDLQAFNTEKVARAIFASALPIISAVGHEVDFTIADFVADVRAATPTAAAELVSPDKQTLLINLARIEKNLSAVMLATIQQKIQETDWLCRRLKHPGQRLGEYQTQLQQIQKLLVQLLQHALLKQKQILTSSYTQLLNHGPQQRIIAELHQLQLYQQLLEQSLQNQLNNYRHQLAVAAAHLDGKSPLKILGRGYSILFQTENQHVVGSVHTIEIGDEITAKLIDGQLHCKVLGKDEITV